MKQKTPEIHENTEPVLRILSQKWGKKLQKFSQKWGKKLQEFTQIRNLY